MDQHQDADHDFSTNRPPMDYEEDAYIGEQQESQDDDGGREEENEGPDDPVQTLPSFTLNIQCPVCQEECPVDNLVPHLMISHPRFFVVWSSYAMPWNMALNDVLNDPMEEDESMFQDYNYLMHLCDTIGYHKEGITNVDEVAPLTIAEENHALNERCPICMDELYGNDPLVRVITKCKHGFCADCIEKWLSENKTCPICVQWLQDEKKEEREDRLPDLEDVD